MSTGTRLAAVQAAKGSPTFLKNPHFHHYLNTTCRGLLTPFEYVSAP